MSKSLDRSKLTPMLQQYYELKDQCEDSILFFRMGDFYEIFGEDALKVAPKLEIVMTSRERGDKEKIPFCGVPHHSAKNYYLKLLKMGFKIAIADQVGDPAESKGIVERKIVTRLSPGCIDELEGLQRDEANYVFAIHQDPTAKKWAVVLIDISTAEIKVGSFEDIAAACDAIEKYRPKEIWARSFFIDMIKTQLKAYLSHHNPIFETLSEVVLRDESAQSTILKATFGDKNLPKSAAYFSNSAKHLLAAVISRLGDMGLSTQRFVGIKPLHASDAMTLSENVIRDLEIFETQARRERQGSLLAQIDYTSSPMAARLLRQNLTTPLVDKKEIISRHDFVAGLVGFGEAKLADLRNIITNLPDLRRLLTRVATLKALPHELLMLAESCSRIHDFSKAVEECGDKQVLDHPFFKNFKRQVQYLLKMSDEIFAALEADEAATAKKVVSFKRGYDKKLDQYRDLMANGQELLADYIDSERKKTGITSLKAKKHKTYGLLLEVTKTHSSKVPAYFIRRQTMVNSERFATPDLDDLCVKLDSAVQMTEERENELYHKLLVSVAKNYEACASAVEVYSLVDLLMSFAWLAVKHEYARPEITENFLLDIKGSRHPVVENSIGKHKFTPNDIKLTHEHRFMLITGPNMAGKSTVMRQIAIAGLLSQVGSFIPAHAATLPVFDNIFTRVGATDNLSGGQSTFMVEMSEAAHILRSASKNSLVIIDEIGRGTSTQDGLAIASAILEALSSDIGCFTLFATHYHELAAQSSRYPNISIMQTLVLEKDGGVEFLHQLAPGASGSSYGIEVAKLAGIPSAVIAAATQYLQADRKFADNTVNAKQDTPELASEELPLEENFSYESANVTQSLPPNFEELKERLEMLKIHRTTPLQALMILNDLKSLVSSRVEQSEFNFYPEHPI